MNLSEIFTLYHERLVLVAIKITKNRESAEDCVQDVYLNLSRDHSRFEGRAKLTTWLHECVKNQALMLKRKSSTRHEGVQLSALPGSDYLNRRNPESTFNTGIDVERAVKKLAPGHKRALIEHDVFGYEHHEMAKRADRSEGAQKSQLFKARRHARSALAGY